jgi:hypothetical protein
VRSSMAGVARRKSIQKVRSNLVAQVLDGLHVMRCQLHLGGTMIDCLQCQWLSVFSCTTVAWKCCKCRSVMQRTSLQASGVGLTASCCR